MYVSPSTTPSRRGSAPPARRGAPALEAVRITVPGGPLRYQGTPQTRATPSPGIGQDDVEVYCELPGLTADDVEALRREGAL